MSNSNNDISKNGVPSSVLRNVANKSNISNTTSNSSNTMQKLKNFFTDFRLWLFLFFVVLGVLLWVYFKKSQIISDEDNKEPEPEPEPEAEPEEKSEPTEPTEPTETFQNKSDPEGIEINSKLYAQCN